MKFAKVKFVLIFSVILSVGLISNAWGQTLPLTAESESMITGDYNKVIAEGNYLYAATTYGIDIFNISNPANPTLVIHFGTSGECLDVVKYSSYLYVADGYKGLMIINVSNPAQPVVTDSLSFVNNPKARSVFFANFKVYVALEQAGVAMVNVADPYNPVVLDIEDTPDKVVDIEYLNGYVYVSDNTTVRSFTTSGNVLTPVSLYGTNETYRGMKIKTVGTNNYLFVANDTSGIDRYTVSAGIFSNQTAIAAYGAQDIATIDTNLVVALKGNGLMTMTTNGVSLGTYTANVGDVMSVWGLGTNIYSAESINGFEVISASDPANLTLLGSHIFYGGPRNIAVAGNYAYIADHEGGLIVMNVADPRYPTIVDTIAVGTTPSWTYDVVVVGNYAYVAEFFSGLYVYDISNPLNLTLVSTYEILLGPQFGGTRALAALGSNNLILVHYDRGVYKFNITDPTHVTLTGILNTDGHPRDVVVNSADSIAFVADYDGHCDIVDVAPATPAPMSEYLGLDFVRAVAYDQNVLFVGSEGAGMDIVNVENPYNPTFVVHYGSIGDIDGMVNDNYHYVYLCSWDKGLEVVSYSVLTNPTQAGVFDTHSLGKAAFYANDLLYFADSYSLYIFACGGSATVALGNVTGFQGMSVTVPITVSSLTGLNVLGWNTTVHFDTSIVHITGASITGTISTGMTILPVVQGDSIIIAAINPPAPLSGSGTLVNLTGTVNSYAPVGSVANLTFSNFMFNGGRPVDYTTNGSVTVTAMYNISGTITYYWPEVGGAPSPNHELDMSGNQTRSTFTNTLGSYAFTAVPYGNYIVHTQKDQTTWIATNIISFSDAVMAAQKAVGLITLTPNQITAADVSGNGAVTTYDATLIAMYSVRTLTPAYHFPVYSTWWMGQYTDWATNPAYVNYSPLNATTVTNYRAILFGDVTGNWSGTGIFANPVAKDELLGEYTIDGDEVTIPISVTDNPEDIEFVQGEMIYNPDKLEFLSFEATGILPSNWTVMENHNEPGHLRFGAANLSGVGDLSLVQTGELFNVSFKILDTKQAIELKLDNYFTEENGSRYTANAVILPSGIPTSYSLKQNYPNPFNPGTSIRFDLKEAGHVSLMIYNTLGQKVRTLVDGEMLPGAYSVEFNGLDDRGLVMASGLYFYQIKCNDFNDTKKMIITK